MVTKVCNINFSCNINLHCVSANGATLVPSIIENILSIFSGTTDSVITKPICTNNLNNADTPGVFSVCKIVAW